MDERVETAGPPVKRLGGDGGRPRRGDEGSRSFDWYVPAKRRATLYEDVTIDTQPSVHRHLPRGWLVNFEDGRSTWWDDSTRLSSTDWYAFRDPGQAWERPYYKEGTEFEHQIEGAVRAAAVDKLFEDFDPEWVEFLRAQLQVPAFVEHGLWLAAATMQRACLSDSIAQCVGLGAAMKQRHAQAIVLYAMDLEEHFGEFPLADARRRFLEDEPWQPSRRYVEQLGALEDWGELIVAANACFEPLVGVLVRRELGIRGASANGDTITPVVARVAQIEWEWIRTWTVEFLRFVTSDDQHGAANREIVGGWAADWLPRAHEAAEALEPIASLLPGGISFDEGLERVRADVRALFAEAGIGELAEVRA